MVERTHSWMNRFRRILVRWDKKPENYLAFLHFACALIAFRAAGLFGRLDVAQPRGAHTAGWSGARSRIARRALGGSRKTAGHGHVVLLTGDAGIGKSRLVQMLKEHVADEPHIRWECRSSEYYQNTALFPLTDLFQRLLRFRSS